MSYATSGPPNFSDDLGFSETGSGLVIHVIESVGGLSQIEAHGDVRLTDAGVLVDWTTDGNSGTRSLIPWSNIVDISQGI